MNEVSVITLDDDIEQLVDEINEATWDEANEISRYEVRALSAYLARQDTVFLACHQRVEGHPRKLLGMASARIELKPYGLERWLYVDEVDVCADQRRKGAGSALMRKLIDLADAADCDEVWLGTEVDNDAANALYQSLAPDGVEQVVGYTYELG